MQMAQQEQQQINELVAQAEAKSGAQVLIVIVAKADAYPEIPWKAFAIAAAFAGLLTAAAAFFRPDWSSAHSGFEAAVILGAGVMFALITIFAPPFARLFLYRPRSEAEVRQYAQTVFLERGVFATRERVGVLLLIARFERAVVILPDIGVRQHLSAAQIEAVIAEMKPLLAQQRIAAVCEAGLSALATLLHDRLVRPATAGNELPDAPVRERGA
jgi:putative membrane protein